MTSINQTSDRNEVAISPLDMIGIGICRRKKRRKKTTSRAGVQHTPHNPGQRRTEEEQKLYDQMCRELDDMNAKAKKNAALAAEVQRLCRFHPPDYRHLKGMEQQLKNADEGETFVTRGGFQFSASWGLEQLEWYEQFGGDGDGGDLPCDLDM